MNAVETFSWGLLSTIVGILMVLWIERQRRPSLTIRLGQPGEMKQGDPLERPPSKWLHAQVHNRNMPRWLARVYQGEPALTCRAWITFHHLDGQRLFDREMIARWSGSDEPTVGVIHIGDKQALRLIGTQNSFDIPPGESTELDVVFRVNGEETCYGWNNESYLHNWRHPDWRLEKGRYIAKIRVRCGGQDYVNTFLIANDVGYDDFRLAEVDNDTKRTLR